MEDDQKMMLEDYPEVDMLMKELDQRVSVLETLNSCVMDQFQLLSVNNPPDPSTSSSGSGGVKTQEKDTHSGDMSDAERKKKLDDEEAAILAELLAPTISAAAQADTPPQDVAKEDVVTITISSEQQRALSGLASNVRGLIRCVSHRYNEQQKITINNGDNNKKVTIKKCGDKELDAGASRRRSNTVFATNRGMMVSRNISTQEAALPCPEELINSMKIFDDAEAEGEGGGGERATQNVSAAYLAAEYGGLALPKRFTLVGQDKKPRKSLKDVAKAMSGANTFMRQFQTQGNVCKDELEYLPSEFRSLSLVERKQLARLLSWDGLKDWGFNVFEIEALSKATDDMETTKQGSPMVLIGWALLASPYSQLAMAKNVDDKELMDKANAAIRKRSRTSRGKMAKLMMDDIDDDVGIGEKEKEGSNTEPEAWPGGYFLPDEFEVAPRAIVCFLRKVEREYSPRTVNPYHNNIHAADVIQSTHALMQMGGYDMEMAYSPLEMYSILLAAACHDIQHPGTNNHYQVNKRTHLSLTYNDVSVLENMHASRASCLLEGLDEKMDDNNGGDGGVLGKMTKEQRMIFRTSMIKSILHTDMSEHFSGIAKMTRHIDALEDDILARDDDDDMTMKPLLQCIGGEKHTKLRETFLPFLLHMADISNATKPQDVSVEWSNAVYDEFFLQGDKEASEGLPISPLCDRATVNRPEAQLGFMNFVIKPAFELLARCIPDVDDVVVSTLNDNFAYWEAEKARSKE